MKFNKNFIIPLLLILFGTVFFLFFVIKMWSFTADDTYITLRYASNWVSGYGVMIWNIGEAPVAGATNFLWVVIQTIPIMLFINPIITIKIIGVLATFLTAIIIFLFIKKILKKLDFNEKNIYLGATFAFAGFLILPISAIHAVSGMETALFTLFFVGFLFLLFKFIELPSNRLALSLGIIAFLFGLTRPEGNLIAISALLTTLILFKNIIKKSYIYIILLFYLVPGILYIIWLLNYFGFILPNSFYVKVLLTNQLFAGKEPTIDFTKYFILHLGLFLFLGLWRVKKEFWPIFISSALFYIFYFFSFHFMGYDYRLLYPLVPILFIFSGIGFATFVDKMNIEKKWENFLLIVIIIMVLSGLLLYANSNIKKRQDYAIGLERAHIALGDDLYNLDQSGKYTIAISDAGAVPYFSKWRVIDTFGLNSNEIAHTKIRDIDFIFKENPVFVVVISSDAEKFEPKLDFEQQVYDRALDLGMEKVDRYDFDKSYSLWIMAYPENNLVKSFLE